MTSYTAVVQEADPSLEALSKNGWNLQVAKCVSSPKGAPVFNVVYSSSYLAANMSVSWTVQYGLNWTENIPTPGAQVTYTGDWSECSLGQSLNLDKAGAWQFNNNDPHADSNSLNVGSNGYQAPVNIVVGIKDPNTGDWSPASHPSVYRFH